MGALEQAIERAVGVICKKKQIIQVLTGTAKNIGTSTCTVERDGAPTLEDVRLDAIDDELTSRFTVYPAENSSVLVGIIEGIKTEAVILKCSEVSKVSFKAGEKTLVMDSNGFVFNGGTAGMVNVDDMVGWMNKVKVDLTAISASLNSLGFPVTISTPSALKTDFEDTKIKH